MIRWVRRVGEIHIRVCRSEWLPHRRILCLRLARAGEAAPVADNGIREIGLDRCCRNLRPKWWCAIERAERVRQFAPMERVQAGGVGRRIAVIEEIEEYWLPQCGLFLAEPLGCPAIKRVPRRCPYT